MKNNNPLIYRLLRKLDKLLSLNLNRIQAKNQNSIWGNLESPVKVISSVVFISIAISPIISAYLILSYLGDYNAKTMAYGIFSNISSWAIVLIYGFAIAMVISLLIFSLPFYFGYISFQYLADIKKYLNNKSSKDTMFSKTISNNISRFYKDNIDDLKLVVILIFIIIIYLLFTVKYYGIWLSILIFYCIFIVYKFIKIKKNIWKFLKLRNIITSIFTILSLTIYYLFKIKYFGILFYILSFISYLVLIVSMYYIFNIRIKKENLIKEYSGLGLFILNIFFILIFLITSFLFTILLLVISLKSQHSNIFLLFIIILFIEAYFFVIGLIYANNKNKSKNLLYILFGIIVSFFIFNINFFHIPFSRITMQNTGMGNYYVKLNLKQLKIKRHKYLTKELKKFKQIKIAKKIALRKCVEQLKKNKLNSENKKVQYSSNSNNQLNIRNINAFLLIQSSHSYYIMKSIVYANKNKQCKIKYYIVKLPKKYVWHIKRIQ